MQSSIKGKKRELFLNLGIYGGLMQGIVGIPLRQETLSFLEELTQKEFLPIIPVYAGEFFPYKFMRVVDSLQLFTPVSDHSTRNRLEKRFSAYNPDARKDLEYWYTSFSLQVSALYAFPRNHGAVGLGFAKTQELEKLLRPVLIHSKLPRKAFFPYMVSKDFDFSMKKPFKDKEILASLDGYNIDCHALAVYKVYDQNNNIIKLNELRLL
jgi:hypothetical protein